jgi:hypothetical protein
MMKRIPIVVILLASPACFGQAQTAKVRTYYVAADEVDWDYAPGGVNKMMGISGGPNAVTSGGSDIHRAGAREARDEHAGQAWDRCGRGRLRWRRTRSRRSLLRRPPNQSKTS